VESGRKKDEKKDTGAVQGKTEGPLPRHKYGPLCKQKPPSSISPGKRRKGDTGCEETQADVLALAQQQMGRGAWQELLGVGKGDSVVRQPTNKEKAGGEGKHTKSKRVGDFQSPQKGEGEYRHWYW